MKRFFTRILAMTLCVTASWAPASLGQSQTFARIAAWNQQSVRFAGAGQVVPTHKPEQLRAAIAGINPDVIALSEVNSPASIDEIIATPLSNGASYKVNMDGGQTGPQQIAVLFRDLLKPQSRFPKQRVPPFHFVESQTCFVTRTSFGFLITCRW